jgi:hypothetical protein
MAIERIQFRRDTAANWTSANPILASGEPALETDTRNTKLGDGVTAWNDLAYQAADGGGGGGGGVTSVAGRSGTVTLTSADLTDATTIGKALISAANQAAGRTAIGAQVAGNYATNTNLDAVSAVADGVQSDLADFMATKGQNSGLASLDSGGKVPSAQLPSYVDDVLEYGSTASFPVTGETGKIYVAQDTNYEYRWSGSTYIRLVASPGSTDAVPEGTTNLYFSDARAQSANVAALALKANLESPAFTGTPTGITKAHVGLGSVDNTADSAKPVSTAQQTALDTKAPLASPALTGNPTAPTQAAGNNSTRIATTAYVDARTPPILVVTTMPGTPVAGTLYFVTP